MTTNTETISLGWIRYANTAALVAAAPHARGCYQRAILDGAEAISGSTLTGKASAYSGRYRTSAWNMIERMRDAGLDVSEIRGAHGRRILVIGVGA